MSDRYEAKRRKVRRSMLLKFLNEFPGTDKEAAGKLGVEPGFLSQIKMGRRKNPDTGKFSGRNIGEDLARSMEDAAGLPPMYFDDDHLPLGRPEVRENSATYDPLSGLSETEARILKLWRTWDPIVKQYVFGQMVLADYTKDVIRDAFVINDRKKLSNKQLEKQIVETVTPEGLVLKK